MATNPGEPTPTSFDEVIALPETDGKTSDRSTADFVEAMRLAMIEAFALDSFNEAAFEALYTRLGGKSEEAIEQQRSKAVLFFDAQTRHASAADIIGPDGAFYKLRPEVQTSVAEQVAEVSDSEPEESRAEKLRGFYSELRGATIAVAREAFESKLDLLVANDKNLINSIFATIQPTQLKAALLAGYRDDAGVSRDDSPEEVDEKLEIFFAGLRGKALHNTDWHDRPKVHDSEMVQGPRTLYGGVQIFDFPTAKETRGTPEERRDRMRKLFFTPPASLWRQFGPNAHRRFPAPEAEGFPRMTIPPELNFDIFRPETTIAAAPQLQGGDFVEAMREAMIEAFDADSFHDVETLYARLDGQTEELIERARDRNVAAFAAQARNAPAADIVGPDGSFYKLRPEVQNRVAELVGEVTDSEPEDSRAEKLRGFYAELRATTASLTPSTNVNVDPRGSNTLSTFLTYDGPYGVDI